MEALSIGKIAILYAISTKNEGEEIYKKASDMGYRLYRGSVGSMDSAKIFAAVETAAKKEGLINPIYREEHSIYHSILEAYTAICRGREGLGNVLRSAGLAFSIVRGPRIPEDTNDGEWIAIVLFGNMGAPIKGYEHEVIGMGINPV
ncbi:MAG TPA: HutP family protein [Anaerovoracaceae bacterium]|nr:HutP family protein [Anaerovoracaceae bacterium]